MHHCKSYSAAFLLLLLSFIASAQDLNHNRLRAEIKRLAKLSSGKIGVSIKLLENNDTLGFNDAQHYPMQSVFKFPIAVSLLRAVDRGDISLDQKVLITKAELLKTVSALQEKYPEGNVKVSVREILTDMVTLSDNNACDILMKLLGGPKKITNDIHAIGVSGLQIKGNEADMQADWGLQYKSWSTPSAQVQLLGLIFRQAVLSKKSNDLLMRLMLSTYVAPGRIRAGLPKGTPLAHRSGTSGTNEQGLSPATNDVGIITFPDSKHLAIAIFLMDSYSDAKKRDLLIADIAKAAYDEFSPGVAQLKKYRESVLKQGTSNLKSDSDIREHYRTLVALDSAFYHIAPDSLTRSQMANHYNSLAWYSIVTQKLDNVKNYLDQSLKFEPGYVYPQANLPLLLLLQGHYPEAEALYLKYKDQPFDKTHATYKEEFLEDFGELKKVGIVNEDIEKITRLLSSKN
jgi:beta-lactamase class A